MIQSILNLTKPKIYYLRRPTRLSEPNSIRYSCWIIFFGKLNSMFFSSVYWNWLLMCFVREDYSLIYSVFGVDSIGKTYLIKPIFVIGSWHLTPDTKKSFYFLIWYGPTSLAILRSVETFTAVNVVYVMRFLWMKLYFLLGVWTVY